jgi:hypothetical protein
MVFEGLLASTVFMGRYPTAFGLFWCRIAFKILRYSCFDSIEHAQSVKIVILD